MRSLLQDLFPLEMKCCLDLGWDFSFKNSGNGYLTVPYLMVLEKDPSSTTLNVMSCQVSLRSTLNIMEQDVGGYMIPENRGQRGNNSAIMIWWNSPEKEYT